jgi:hypothetical protein
MFDQRDAGNLRPFARLIELDKLIDPKEIVLNVHQSPLHRLGHADNLQSLFYGNL